MSETEELLPPIEIPPENLNADVLTEVIENFILREGTDYGAAEVSLTTKIAQVQKQIIRGDVLVVFDPNTETVTLMNRARR